MRKVEIANEFNKNFQSVYILKTNTIEDLSSWLQSTSFKNKKIKNLELISLEEVSNKIYKLKIGKSPGNKKQKKMLTKQTTNKPLKIIKNDISSILQHL